MEEKFHFKLDIQLNNQQHSDINDFWKQFKIIEIQDQTILLNLSNQLPNSEFFTTFGYNYHEMDILFQQFQLQLKTHIKDTQIFQDFELKYFCLKLLLISSQSFPYLNGSERMMQFFQSYFKFLPLSLSSLIQNRLKTILETQFSNEKSPVISAENNLSENQDSSSKCFNSMKKLHQKNISIQNKSEAMKSRNTKFSQENNEQLLKLHQQILIFNDRQKEIDGKTLSILEKKQVRYYTDLMYLINDFMN